MEGHAKQWVERYCELANCRDIPHTSLFPCSFFSVCQLSVALSLLSLCLCIRLGCICSCQCDNWWSDTCVLWLEVRDTENRCHQSLSVLHGSGAFGNDPRGGQREDDWNGPWGEVGQDRFGRQQHRRGRSWGRVGEWACSLERERCGDWWVFAEVDAWRGWPVGVEHVRHLEKGRVRGWWERFFVKEERNMAKAEVLRMEVIERTGEKDVHRNTGDDGICPDPPLQRRRNEICWRTVTSMLPNCFEMLVLDTNWKTWYSLVSEQTCTIDYKMDHSLWQTVFSFDIWRPSHMRKQEILLWETRHNNADYDCFKTPTWQEIF